MRTNNLTEEEVDIITEGVEKGLRVSEIHALLPARERSTISKRVRMMILQASLGDNAPMPHDEYEGNRFFEANEVACALHLADLRREHGVAA